MIQQAEGRRFLNRKGVPGEQKLGVAYPCFPRKMEMEGEGCPRELRARGRYNIQGWGGDPSGGRAAHCIKVYHLRFFLIIIAFVDNGPGIICYREMSWSRNFLNYFGSQLFFFRPRFTLPSPPFPLPFLPPVLSSRSNTVSTHSLPLSPLSGQRIRKQLYA